MVQELERICVISFGDTNNFGRIPGIGAQIDFSDAWVPALLTCYLGRPVSYSSGLTLA